MLTIKLIYDDSKAVDLRYKTIDDCLLDTSLRALFDDMHVKECAIYYADRLMAKVPMLTWRRFKDQTIANSAAILHAQHPVTPDATFGGAGVYAVSEPQRIPKGSKNAESKR